MISKINGKTKKVVNLTLNMTRIRYRVFAARNSFYCLMLLLTVFIVSNNAQSQSSLNGPTPVTLAPGNTAGAYSPSNVESINLFGGRVNITVPLLNINGRGGAGINLSAAVEQSTWATEYRPGGSQEYPSLSAIDGNAQLPVWSKPEKIGAGLLSQRIISGGPWTMSSADPNNEPPNSWSYSNTMFVYIEANGTEHFLYDEVTGGVSTSYQHHNQSFEPNPIRGRIFSARDGSGLTFVSDYETSVHIGYTPGDQEMEEIPGNGYLKTEEGTVYRFENGLARWIRDSNGNKTTFTYATKTNPPYAEYLTKITDSNNREVLVNGNQITYKGTNGATRTITLNYGTLSNNFRLNSGYAVHTIGQLFPSAPNSGSPGSFFNAGGVYNPGVLSSITLPDGRNYRFFYNPYGELARMETPSGAAVEYDYGVGVASIGNSIPVLPSGQIGAIRQESINPGNEAAIYRRLRERREYANGGSGLTLKTTYSLVDLSNSKVEVEDIEPTTNIVLTKSLHYFNGNPISRLFPGGNDIGYPISAPLDGIEKKTEQLDPSNNTVLARIENDWSDGCTAERSYCMTNGLPWSRYLVRTANSILDVTTGQYKKTKKEYSYDNYNNLTDTYEYDFGDNQIGQFLRRTHTDYVSQAEYTSATQTHLRSLTAQTWISSDAGGVNKVSLAQLEYDNYANDATHASLVGRSNVSGHDSTTYSIGNPWRGNVTRSTSFGNASAQSEPVSAYSQYDILGNIVKTIDAKGNVSTIGYSDNFGAPNGDARTNSSASELIGLQTFAFPTSSTNPIGWLTYAQFDYYINAKVDEEDIHGNVNSTFYNDPLDRPTQVITANNTALRQQINTIYDDATRRVLTSADLYAFGDNLSKSETFYDGIGRTVQSRKYEENGGYVATLTEYDALGRVKRVTNPFRPTQNEPQLWTISSYDALSRSVSVITPDNSTVSTSYSGNAITVTDQAGKQRRSITNGLEQLIRVDEPDASGNLGSIGSPAQPTNYIYDTLGNLIQVVQPNPQGGQTRSFQYDSLSRLRQATNPESGTILYNYDAGGNLVQKIDARGVQISYIYDALDRVTQRSYANLPSTVAATPTVNYTYDDPAITFSKGNLTKIASAISETRYTSFDNLGKVLASQQLTDGQTYNFGYQYNLAGMLTQQTYPSGRTVTNQFEADGDLAQISGAFGGNNKTYAGNFNYTSAGAISAIQLGNNRWETTAFNARLQPVQIGLGMTANDQSLLKLNFDYGANNNGNVLSQQIAVSGQVLATQNYNYDSVNRLKSAEEDNGQSWKQVFNYDRYGNRNFDASQTTMLGNCPPAICNPTIDQNNNRLVGYQYDAAGNTRQDAEQRQLIYDAENKQVQVRNAQGTDIGTYFYDGDGKRVKKVAAQETTLFAYDASGKLAAEYTVSGIQAQTPQTSYLTNDHLGSPRITTRQDGTVQSRRDFMPFGEEITGLGNRTSANGYQADPFRQKFTSYQRDNESELDFAQARYYSSKIGRFHSVDPENYGASEDDAQSWNAYAYSRNNPLLYTDHNGLDYRICNDRGECVTQGDKIVKDAQRKLRELFKETGKTGDFDSGNILNEDGSVLGTYQRVSIDPEYQFVYSISRESTKKAKVVAGAAAGAAAVGVCIGLPGACPAIARAAVRVLSVGKTATKFCFVANTPILTENGLKPIEEIKEGDKVLSYNEQTKQTEYKTVMQTMMREAEAGRILSLRVQGEAEALGVTGEHPFYVRVHGAERIFSIEGEWVEAKELRVGNEIRKANGAWAKVESVTERKEGAKVYNFEVADNHNYFVGKTSLLAHNNCFKYLQQAIRAATPPKNGPGLEYVMKGGAKLIFRKDFGAKAHAIGKKYPNAVDHYNVDVHVPYRGGFQKETTFHIIVDAAGKVIDVIE